MPGMLQINGNTEGQRENVEISQETGHVGSDELLTWKPGAGEAGNSKGINALTS